MPEEVLKTVITGDASGLDKASKNAVTSLDKIGKSATQATVQLSNIKRGSGEATQALNNLSRVAQDAPYGFIGISNNINPLLESFQRLKTSTGTTGGALKALVGELTGAGGLGLAVGVASSLLVVFGDRLFGAGKKADEQVSRVDQLKKAFNELKAVTASEILGSTGSEFSKAISTIETLRENVDLAKKGFISKKEVVSQYNKELGDTIGKVQTLSEVEQQLAQKGEAYLKFTLLKAAAQEALKKASESALQAAENEAKATDVSTNAFTKAAQKTFTQTGNTTGLSSFNQVVKKETKEFQKSADDANKQKDRFIDIFKDFQSRAAEIAKNNKFSFSPDVKTEKTKQDKTSFLFDFLPFDPSGKLKPEQRQDLLQAIDKFSKEFGGIIQGARFLQDTDEGKIKAARQLDLDLKAGNVKFDLTAIRNGVIKGIDGLKPEDLVPPDKLQATVYAGSGSIYKRLQK
jgi:hypothetical protein